MQRDVARAAVSTVPELRQQLGRAEGEAAALQQVASALQQVVARQDLQIQQVTGRTSRAEAAASAAEGELAGWSAGGALARAWRALVFKRDRT